MPLPLTGACENKYSRIENSVRIQRVGAMSPVMITNLRKDQSFLCPCRSSATKCCLFSKSAEIQPLHLKVDQSDNAP